MIPAPRLSTLCQIFPLVVLKYIDIVYQIKKSSLYAVKPWQYCRAGVHNLHKSYILPYELSILVIISQTLLPQREKALHFILLFLEEVAD